jgi:hypothetical protein
MKQLRKLGAVGLCLAVGMVALPNIGFAADFTGDPYTLDTCPISGGKLGSMGDPIVLTIDNREFRICCAGCKAKIISETASVVKDIDAKMVVAQLPYYPLETGLVSGETLGPKAVNLIHFNRLVRLADRNQAQKFRSDPDTYLAKLDAAVIEKQNADYPLKKCPISGDKLTAMGKPIDVVIANRLLKTCCPGCVAGVVSDPLAAFANLDGEPIKKKGSHSKKKGDHDEHGERHDHEEGHDH